MYILYILVKILFIKNVNALLPKKTHLLNTNEPFITKPDKISDDYIEVMDNTQSKGHLYDSSYGSYDSLYESQLESSYKEKSKKNNEYIDPYDIIRNYRKLDDMRKNLIDHNLIEHMIKSGGIDMVIRFLKTFYPELMWNSVTQSIKNDFKTFYKIIRDPNGRRALEYFRRRKTNILKTDDSNDWEDKITVVTKPYRDKYSYKINWANSWKDSDVW
jgi:hypothetical protein